MPSETMEDFVASLQKPRTMPTGLIHVILHGAQLPSTELRPEALRMQGHAWRLDDDEVAALATFLRQGWHNQASAVSAGAVQPLR